jgi:hypothetical protein
MPKKRTYKPRKCIRQRIWKNMRILGKFTIPDLCRTVQGATQANVQSFVSRLFTAGYLRKQGEVRRGYPGEYQQYVLVNNIGPTMPVLQAGRFKKTDEKTEKEKEPTILTEELNHDAA